MVALSAGDRAIAQLRLGGAGLRVSRLGLGRMSYGKDPDRAWALDQTAAEPIVRKAIEAGFTFFDTADMYSQGESEVLTGRLLRKFISREGPARRHAERLDSVRLDAVPLQPPLP